MQPSIFLLGLIAAVLRTDAISTTSPRSDGRCGVAFRWATCDPSGPYGGCCSSTGHCGSSAADCSEHSGCQLGCGVVVVVSSSSSFSSSVGQSSTPWTSTTQSLPLSASSTAHSTTSLLSSTQSSLSSSVTVISSTSSVSSHTASLSSSTYSSTLGLSIATTSSTSFFVIRSSSLSSSTHSSTSSVKVSSPSVVQSSLLSSSTVHSSTSWSPSSSTKGPFSSLTSSLTSLSITKTSSPSSSALSRTSSVKTSSSPSSSATTSSAKSSSSLSISSTFSTSTIKSSTTSSIYSSPSSSSRYGLSSLSVISTTAMGTSTSKRSSAMSSSTSKPTTSFTSTSKSTSKTFTSSSATSTGTGKAFAHYMVGTMTEAEAVTDIQQAQAMGLDALALNVVSSDSWSTTAVSYLFSAALDAGFKVFFSFDMTAWASPTDFIPLLQQYYYNDAYFLYEGLPFVSTFYGGNLIGSYSSSNAYWQSLYRDALAQLNMPTYFVPSFSDSTSTTASTLFANYPVVDGNFDWDASWPWVSDGIINVTSSDDATLISTGRAQGKTYMMGISALQFKHIDSSQNWYRLGGLDLALRISQVLDLRPDFMQIQTWNDAGESSYIGTLWPEAIAGTVIPQYTDGYDHSGWQVLMASFVSAYKAGARDISQVVPTGSATVQGVFWHSTLLSTATCNGDSLEKPSGSENIEDTIEIAVLVAPGVTGVTVRVYSGGNVIASYSTVQGLNAWHVPGMVVGLQKVDVLAAGGTVLLSATGSISVLADSSYCNYNPQVVALV